MIAVVNYGMGNLRSVVNAFGHLGEDVTLVPDPDSAPAWDDVSHLVVPGVGAFAAGMANLRERKLDRYIFEAAERRKPILGICLGMQILASSGTEGGEAAGLGLIPGRVERIPDELGVRLPHVGWNALREVRSHPVLRRVAAVEMDVYFVHSYHFLTDSPDDLICVSDYGQPLAAAVGRENLVGVQFHPEKSQDAGIRILENFIEWDGKI